MSVTVDSAEIIWKECMAIIASIVDEMKVTTWFKPLRAVSFENHVLTLEVPSPFWVEWIEEHYNDVLYRAVHRILGPQGRLEYSAVVQKADNGYEAHALRIPQQAQPLTRVSEPFSGFNYPQQLQASDIPNPFVIPGVKKLKVESNLNPNYVFERYIEGDCNKMARAAALAIAENPGKTSFNPFFVYGGVGLGKTHLIQSIGNKVKQLHGDSKNVLYISSESFTNDFVHAIRNNRVREFTMFYRNIDVLIVDDIQFFSQKEKTQEEFFHIFNALHQEGKQIILSSDRAPKDIPDIEERLLSRFAWGLAADLQVPEFETRYAILERKATDNGVEFDPRILEFIAQNFKSSIRDLEGAIIKLLAVASLQDIDQIDLPMAKQILKDMVKESKIHISIESIQNHVAEYFSLDPNKLREKVRKQEIVEARQVAMFLAKQLTKSSLKTIGLHFGGRDHSTVIHAITSIEDRAKTVPKFARQLHDIQNRIELASM
jgi:chromosomal replication initiator protein